MMELDLQGKIEQFTLPEIFQLIASGRKSGTLGIQKDDSIVMVYFRDGKIFYGYGPRQTFHLGQLLKEKGLLSGTQLEEAIKIQSKTDNSRRLGEIMISQSFIDRADLQGVVKSQIEELLYSLLNWQTGSFKFYENQFPTVEEITVSISVENVILEGLRRLDERNMIDDTLPDLEAVYSISAAQTDQSREIAFQGMEWNVMALVDGHRSINEICKRANYDRTEVLKTLAQLTLAGILTKTEKRQQTSSVKLEKMVERLAGLFEDYLTERPAAAPTANRRISQEFVESID